MIYDPERKSWLMTEEELNALANPSHPYPFWVRPLVIAFCSYTVTTMILWAVGA